MARGTAGLSRLAGKHVNAWQRTDHNSQLEPFVDGDGRASSRSDGGGDHRVRVGSATVIRLMTLIVSSRVLGVLGAPLGPVKSKGYSHGRSSEPHLAKALARIFPRIEIFPHFCQPPCLFPSANEFVQVIELRKFAAPVLRPTCPYRKRQHRAVLVQAQKLMT